MIYVVYDGVAYSASDRTGALNDAGAHKFHEDILSKIFAMRRDPCWNLSKLDVLIVAMDMIHATSGGRSRSVSSSDSASEETASSDKQATERTGIHREGIAEFCGRVEVLAESPHPRAQQEKSA